MATGKVTPALAVELNLCYSMEAAQSASVGGGKGSDGEYTVDEVLLDHPLPYDDAMFLVCRTEITPTKVLRDFAALVARENLSAVTSRLGDAKPFKDAVNFISTGDADAHPADLAEHAEKIQKYMVSALAIEGPGDYDNPEKVAAYETLLKACKSVRAATKANPGEAAYGASNWAYRAASVSSRDKLGRTHREQLAKLFRAS